MIALLDMDEVLVDFVGGACRVHGADLNICYAHWEAGAWSMLPALSKVKGMSSVMTMEEFWEPINHRKEFWENLKPLPWAEDLLRLVREVSDEWYVISSPSQCVTSYDGKVRWLKNFFGPSFNNFALIPHKHLFARPNTVLIDDREESVYKFIQHGGRGLVFPRWNNSLYTLRATPIEYIRTCLSRYSK